MSREPLSRGEVAFIYGSRWDRRSPCAGTYALALSREGWETGRMEAIG